MRFGLFGINTGPCGDPDVMRNVSVAAENAGFESLWTAEHVVLPDPQAPLRLPRPLHRSSIPLLHCHLSPPLPTKYYSARALH